MTSLATRTLATFTAGSIFLLSSSAPGAFASKPGASLDGKINSRDGTPLQHAVVLAADVRTDAMFTSAETTDAGRFVLAALPAGTYDLAIKSGEGLYLVDGPVALGASETKTLSVAVDPKPARRSLKEEGSTGPAKGAIKKTSFFKNPLTIALMFLGTAAVVGVLISDNDNDHSSASPSNP